MPIAVPFLAFVVDNFNPNHRVRLLGFGDSSRYLFDIASAKPDDSFYLAPKLAQPVDVRDGRNDASFNEVKVPPEGDFHVSFHESGAVNLHMLGRRHDLRRAGSRRGAHGLTARLIFKSMDLFQEVSDQEVNSLPKRYTPVPVAGLWGVYPICLDIYQTPRSENWEMPRLANVLQFDMCVKPTGKDYDYHFLVWQHTDAKVHQGDVVIRYAPEPAPGG